MSNVFLPQLPSRFDTTLRTWIPTINIDGASKFGQVHVVLPPDAARLGHSAMAEAVKKRMAEFKAGDYIIGVGDPAAIALCAIFAAQRSRAIRMLRWDRISRSYNQLEFNI